MQLLPTAEMLSRWHEKRRQIFHCIFCVKTNSRGCKDQLYTPFQLTFYCKIPNFANKVGYSTSFHVFLIRENNVYVFEPSCKILFIAWAKVERNYIIDNTTLLDNAANASKLRLVVNKELLFNKNNKQIQLTIKEEIFSRLYISLASPYFAMRRAPFLFFTSTAK